MVFHIQLVAKLLNARKIHTARKAHVHRDRNHLEGYGIKATQVCQRAKQGQRVLARRNAHRDLVARADHVVIRKRAARIAQ